MCMWGKIEGTSITNNTFTNIVNRCRYDTKPRAICQDLPYFSIIITVHYLESVDQVSLPLLVSSWRRGRQKEKMLQILNSVLYCRIPWHKLIVMRAMYNYWSTLYQFYLIIVVREFEIDENKRWRKIIGLNI